MNKEYLYGYEYGSKCCRPQEDVLNQILQGGLSGDTRFRRRGCESGLEITFNGVSVLSFLQFKGPLNSTFHRDLIEETTSPTTTYSSLGEDISQDIPQFSRPNAPGRRSTTNENPKGSIVNLERDHTHTKPANQLHVEQEVGSELSASWVSQPEKHDGNSRVNRGKWRL
jgi:hypothetical protein